MRIHSRSTLQAFWRRHPDAEDPLRKWYRAAKTANWDSPAAIRRDYAADASIIPGNRVVFNIKGNRYRLVVRIDYANRLVFVRFVGTHSEYDRIDSREV